MRPNGQAIRDRRASRGETVEALALRIGIARETLRRIELGQTEDARPVTMKAIAEALGCSVEEIAADGEQAVPA